MNFHSAATDNRLARALAGNLDVLIALWQDLGVSGPTWGSPAAGPPELARERYLRPLARALVGGLHGSADHAALYFDERTRYVDHGMPRVEMRHLMTKRLNTEIRAIAKAFGDVIPVDESEEQLQVFHEPLLAPRDPTAKILFIGDCLFVETRAFLVQYALSVGCPVDVRHVFFSVRQPIASVSSAVVDEVKCHKPDLIGLSLFTYEGVPPYTFAFRQAQAPLGGRRAADSTVALVDLVREAIDDIRVITDATIAVQLPSGAALGRFRRKMPIFPAHSSGQRRFLAKLRAEMKELIAATSNTIELDEMATVRKLGGVRAAIKPAFAVSDVPLGYAHTTRLGPALAREYRDLVADYALLGRAKAVFVDFDNTLWQGVMAEGDVKHDTAGQRLLLDLKNSGILLVALSKNDESAIRWEEMVLSPDDFAVMKINWRPKPENVSEAIDELNLAADAFILLDDSPQERALVTAMNPGVQAIDPADPASWRALRNWLEFPSTRQTDEARHRTQMYREAAQRRTAMSQAYDYGAMMKSLALRYRVTLAGESDLPRLIELIQRTNQFNTTTRRMSADDIRSMLASTDRLIYVASLRDKFGSLGVIAVAIFDKNDRCFDSVIMSCRAMGFGVEFALLRSVMDNAGPGEFRGVFIPTDRNGPAAELFAQAGFQVGTDESWYLPANASGPSVPDWLGFDT